MSAKIISVANRKGGVSKTTTGLFLATALAKNKKLKVLYLDADSQASACEYRAFEKELEEYQDIKPPYKILKKDPSYLIEEIQDYSEIYDVIFIDIPRFTHGKEDRLMVAILAACTSILIPIKSGELDNLSTLKFIEMLRKIEHFKKEKGKTFQYVGFLSMTGRRPTDDADTRAFVKEQGIPLLKNELRDVRELSTPYTFDSLLDMSKGTKERFNGFFKEVVKTLDL